MAHVIELPYVSSVKADGKLSDTPPSPVEVNWLPIEGEPLMQRPSDAVGLTLCF